jgi:hypothetical protein
MILGYIFIIEIKWFLMNIRIIFFCMLCLYKVGSYPKLLAIFRLNLVLVFQMKPNKFRFISIKRKTYVTWNSNTVFTDFFTKNFLYK